jgi:hypothetical protein
VDEKERIDLGRAVAAMVGDPSGVFAFHARFGDDLQRTVRAVLGGWGRRDLLADSDEVEGMAMDAALVIAERAGSWDPQGAPPWVWARRAIEADLARSVGHARAPVDTETLESVLARGAPLASSGAPAVDAWDRLGNDEPAVVLLRAAIDGALGDDPRARALYVEFRVQKLLGDPSPSQTLARLFALSSANVRQIASRSHRRVAALVHADERFRSLRDVAWFAP